MKVLITGSGGLIGSEAAEYYLKRNAVVVGIDNNMRKYFFGLDGDITSTLTELQSSFYDKYVHKNIDIRNRTDLLHLFKLQSPFDLIIHTAAQPSHDWAKNEPFTDFEVNAAGTLNLLEAFRLYSPDAVFIHMSTNKVYGDTPNKATLTENDKRYDFAERQELAGISANGINEALTIDNSTHSLFGASKVASDILAQEYGRYFGLSVGVFRGGCLTGPQHHGVKLHGFLSYIIDCAVHKRPYTIIGYYGKQVRDQIHSKDVVRAFDAFYKHPKKGEAYNIGGGKENSASILEVVDLLKKEFGMNLKTNYLNTPRVGDHICYYTDLNKFTSDYSKWYVHYSLLEIIEDILRSKHA